MFSTASVPSPISLFDEALRPPSGFFGGSHVFPLVCSSLDAVLFRADCVISIVRIHQRCLNWPVSYVWRMQQMSVLLPEDDEGEEEESTRWGYSLPPELLLAISRTVGTAM